MIAVWLACAFTGGMPVGAILVWRSAPQIIARMPRRERAAFATKVNALTDD